MNAKPNVDVRALADLARIAVSEEELSALADEIPEILAFVEQVNEVGGVETEAEDALRNVMRDDSEPHEPGRYTENLLAAAPRERDRYVEVRQVLKKDSK